MTIEAKDFCETLLANGYDYFTGVPCSFFKGVINYSQSGAAMKYMIAANEGSAMGLAAGAYLAGRKPAVMIQNSGLGNMVNPLTSLHAIYKIPALLLISGRAYGIDDEPQHALMGRAMRPLLADIEIPCADAATELGEFREQLKAVSAQAWRDRTPFALLVKHGGIGEYPWPKSSESAYPLSRIEAIRIALQYADDKTVIVATTGMPSRELFALRDHPSQLYLMGSMGHAMAVACGIATERPDLKVMILDGDGSAIMHLGSFSTIGYYRPANLVHIILDNEAYETTGNQDTTSKTTDFAGVAKACSIASASSCNAEAPYRAALADAFAKPGPHLIHLKINRVPAERLPRLTTKYSAAQIAENFAAFIRKK